jgi:tryptophanyl-tRNA synthetase
MKKNTKDVKKTTRTLAVRPTGAKYNKKQTNKQKKTEANASRTRFVLREAALVLEVEKQLAALQVVEHKVQLGRRLERVPQTHQERVLQRLQNQALGLGVLHLPSPTYTQRDTERAAQTGGE